MPSFVSLADGQPVLRVAKRTKHFFKPPNLVEPTRELFKPTDSDREEGARRNRPAGVSVFDLRRVTPKEAIGVREAMSNATLPDAGVYQITLSKIRDVAKSVPIALQIELVTDPILDGEQRLRKLSGACGHCAIEGLDPLDPKVRKSADYKALLDKLAVAAIRAA